MLRLKAKKIKLQTILMIVFSFILLICILAMITVFYKYCSNLIISKAISYYEREMNYVGNQLTQKLVTIEGVAVSISENAQILNLLSDTNDKGIFTEIESGKTISDILSSMAYSRSDISNISIVTNKINTVNYSLINGIYAEDRLPPHISENTWLKKDKGWIYLDSGVFNLPFQSRHLLSFYKNIYFKNSSNRLGTVFINLTEQSVCDLLEKSRLDTDSTIFILNERNTIISHRNKEVIGKQFLFRKKIESISNKNESIKFFSTINKERHLVIINRLSAYGWSIVQYTPVKKLVSGIGSVLVIIITMGLGIFLIAGLLSVLIAYLVTRPVRNLVHSMNKVNEGNIDIKVDGYMVLELDQLGRTFNNMIVNIKNLIKSIEEEARIKREAELRLLQAQINPHFLYNTLELINWLAVKAGVSRISDIVFSLSQLLRIGLNKGEDFLTLERELEHVRSYINLQLYKYENSFSVEWDVDAQVMDRYTLKLILQPLVENSIMHGFRKSRGEGRILISARKIACGILLIVEDDGEGIPEARLKEVLDSRSSGYGVRNVHERINLRFGCPYGLKYISEEGKGVRVEVRIPEIKDLDPSGKEIVC